MPMQRIRADYPGLTQPSGALPWYFGAPGMGWRILAKVQNCPCEDGKPRTVYITGQPDTYFSIPAATRVKGRYVAGYVTSDENGMRFECMDRHRDRMFPALMGA